MMVLGITGSIASGKSSVSRLLQDRGAALISADQLAREVVQPGSSTLARLVERFGPGILQVDGTLDRARLGELIFAEPAARHDLNDITHPAIASLAIERLQQLRQAGHALVVYEAPLLFEAGAEGRVDKVLVVKIDPGEQLRRLMLRDGIDEAAARRRIAAQMPQEEKLARADYVIDNSGTPKETERQVTLLWPLLTTKSELRPEN